VTKHCPATVWSTWDYVVDDKRSSLSHDKQEQSVFCYEWLHFKRATAFSMPGSNKRTDVDDGDDELDMPDVADPVVDPE
jgi:hypothetical protein